ncbi:MAG: DNA-directed RNA polymerase subunit alpha [Bacteroidia bacterium]|nr:DNA-directed RNA polymerase subunit alpha [Bacteroidia bacterium]
MGIFDNFQIPQNVVMEKVNDFEGRFTFEPLEKGYGITIGNALRRVLLSSLEGYAFTSVRISGVEHEFSTIPGVVQDVTEMILNLKAIRLKPITHTNEKIVVKIKNQSTFTGKDIAKVSSAFEVLNPDQLICEMDPEVAAFEIELTAEKGRGYVPAEENRKGEQVIGVIPIDSIHTPIKNVKYEVENTRVGQKTDYEKLILEIKTDGSISPEESLKQAANILIRHFMLFSDQNIQLYTEKPEVKEEVDENYHQMRKLLKTSLADLDLSVRAYNCLKAADIKTLGDLVQYNINDMLKFRNFGKKSLHEIEELIAEKGLSFGMDVSKYRLDED